MIVTEKRAWGLWCPFARVHLDHDVNDPRDVAVNRCSSDIVVGAHCIGSECMAWREVTPDPDPDDYREEAEGARGYCGLAGTPSAIA